MRIPDSLASLFEYGVLDDVVRPLMSGKEAQVYLVVSGGKYAVAKIYKEAQNRTFKHRSEYTEGRKVRNSRDQRAIGKRSKHGRQQDEAAWRSTEVDMIHRLHAAGVRVPVPYHFIDGVLVMELILDADGNPAPRLGDIALDRDAAMALYERLVREVVKMLCAGVVHCDLSEFNVLVSGDGPVIIDFPQSIDSAHNQNARKLLVRDVDNLHRFLQRAVPGARRPPYAQEMWSLYEQNLLTPDTRLRGDYRPPVARANTASVLDLIDDANRDERRRRDSLGIRGGPAHPGARPAPARTESRPEEPTRAPRNPQMQGGRDPREARPPQTQQHGRPQHSPPQQQGRPQNRDQQQGRPQNRDQQQDRPQQSQHPQQSRPQQSRPQQSQHPQQSRHPQQGRPQQNQPQGRPQQNQNQQQGRPQQNPQQHQARGPATQRGPETATQGQNQRTRWTRNPDQRNQRSPNQAPRDQHASPQRRLPEIEHKVVRPRPAPEREAPVEPRAEPSETQARPERANGAPDPRRRRVLRSGSTPERPRDPNPPRTGE